MFLARSAGRKKDNAVRKFSMEEVAHDGICVAHPGLAAERFDRFDCRISTTSDSENI